MCLVVKERPRATPPPTPTVRVHPPPKSQTPLPCLTLPGIFFLSSFQFLISPLFCKQPQEKFCSPALPLQYVLSGSYLWRSSYLWYLLKGGVRLCVCVCVRERERESKRGRKEREKGEKSRSACTCALSLSLPPHNQRATGGGRSRGAVTVTR